MLQYELAQPGTDTTNDLVVTHIHKYTLQIIYHKINSIYCSIICTVLYMENMQVFHFVSLLRYSLKLYFDVSCFQNVWWLIDYMKSIELGQLIVKHYWQSVKMFVAHLLLNHNSIQTCIHINM